MVWLLEFVLKRQEGCHAVNLLPTQSLLSGLTLFLPHTDRLLQMGVQFVLEEILNTRSHPSQRV